MTPAERRRQLIEVYGVTDNHGSPTAVCAYCLTTRGVIEVDHLLPRSRGGTDAWANLALACAACNARKGERTPEEAGMPLLLGRGEEPPLVQREAPYVGQTSRLLRQRLRASGLPDVAANDASLPVALISVARTVLRGDHPEGPLVVAKPVARGRKQRYTARLYPLRTPTSTQLRRVGSAVRRLARVNGAIAIMRQEGRTRIAVMPVGGWACNEIDGRTVIRAGMLCTAVRAGEPVTGIVDAIHSAGRLTLQVLDDVQPDRVNWRRVVISPRRNLRALSNAGVVFLRPVESAERGK